MGQNTWQYKNRTITINYNTDTANLKYLDFKTPALTRVYELNKVVPYFKAKKADIYFDTYLTDGNNVIDGTLKLNYLNFSITQEEYVNFYNLTGKLGEIFQKNAINGLLVILTDLDGNNRGEGIRCFNSETLTFQKPIEFTENVTNPSWVDYQAQSDGVISFQIINDADGNMSYTIDDGETWQNNPNFYNLSRGTYKLKVKNLDDGGYSITKTITLTPQSV